MIPEIRTERLVLRGWTDADRPAFAAISADPLVRATLGPLLSPEQADAEIDRAMAHWAEHGFGWWCVELDGGCIGLAGLTDPGFMSAVDVGWRVSSSHWGKGYAPEAGAYSGSECLLRGLPAANTRTDGNTRMGRAYRVGSWMSPNGRSCCCCTGPT